MEFKTLMPHLSVFGQMTPELIEEAAKQGFKIIVNNRPDGEAPDQPSSADLEACAIEHGLNYIYLPISPGEMPEQAIEGFAELLSKAQQAQAGPILAFCRSGMRSTSLWALAQVTLPNAQGVILDPYQIVAMAAAAGYNLSSMEPYLESRASRV